MIGEVRKVPFASRSVIGQRNVKFDTVGKGQARGHGTPDFGAQSGRGIKKEIFKVLWQGQLAVLVGPEKEAGVAIR